MKTKDIVERVAGVHGKAFGLVYKGTQEPITRESEAFNQRMGLVGIFTGAVATVMATCLTVALASSTAPFWTVVATGVATGLVLTNTATSVYNYFSSRVDLDKLPTEAANEAWLKSREEHGALREMKPIGGDLSRRVVRPLDRQGRAPGQYLN